MHPAFSKVFRTCAKSNLDFRNRSVLLQVSGGPDSIFLLHSFHALFGDITKGIEVVTINFGLRGEESKAEADFVAGLCRSLDLPCQVIKAPHLGDTGIQKKARDFRLQQVSHLMQKHQLDFTLVGHHLDDVLETLFLKLKRGAGLFSLASFGVVRGNCIRPLVYYSKSEILKGLKTLHLPYKIDSSNLKNNYLRNRLRNDVFKSLDDNLGPWREGFLASYEDLRHSSSLLQQFILSSQIIQVREGMLVLTSPFMNLSAYQQQIALKLYLKKVYGHCLISRGLLAEMRKNLVEERPGEYVLGGETYASEKGLFYKKPKPLPGLELGLARDMEWKGNRFSFTPSISSKPLDLKGESKGRPETVVGTLVFSFPREVKKLLLRPPKPGDRMYLPKVGRKKIGDIFTDAKIPHLLRSLAWVLEGEGETVGVIISDMGLFDFFKKHRDLKRNHPFWSRGDGDKGKWKYTFTWRRYKR